MRKPFLLGLVLAAGLSVAACDIKTDASGDFSFNISGGKAQDTWTRTYTLPDKGRIELINVNGRITAEPATDGKVTIEGRRTAKGSTDEAAKELLAKLEIREEVSGDRVRVESRPPRMSGFNGHEIEWTVKVPKGVIVDVRTVNGGVRLNGLEGEVHAKTTNGGVKGSNITATILDASSVNGGVRVSDLDVRKQEQSNSFESKRRLEGTLNGGGAKVNISTTNGGVRIGRSAKPTT